MEETQNEQPLIWSRDPATIDMQAAILLRSLIERDGRSLGPIMVGALLHAADRLWLSWDPGPAPALDEDDEDEDEDDGPLSIDGGPGREMMFS